VQLPGSSDTAASFEFKKEDHTLGNALRYIIMKKYALLSLSLSFLKLLLRVLP
jgi:DNA-directed RNA polymerase subunit L